MTHCAFVFTGMAYMHVLLLVLMLYTLGDVSGNLTSMCQTILRNGVTELHCSQFPVVSTHEAALVDHL